MSHHNRHAAKARQETTEDLLEINSGKFTLYTAYLIVCIRLIVLVAHTIVPGLQ